MSDCMISQHAVVVFRQSQGRIQDFEMGGENIKKFKKSNIISIFEG